AALTHLPELVALAVIESLAAIADTVAVQLPLPSAVAVPIRVLPALNTVIAAFASLVPLTLVLPTHSAVVVITGVPVVACTSAEDAALTHLPELVALAVTESLAAIADTVAVQLPLPLAV